MKADQKISIDTFKIVTRAVAESKSLEVMAEHLCQLLVAALEIKGCTIFVMNPSTTELEILGSFGLSAEFLSKGPVLSDTNIKVVFDGKPMIVPDANQDERLQYPLQTQKEGISAVLSIPIIFLSQTIGFLRLYHSQKWNPSEKDIDSLLVLAEVIGLALRYTVLLNAARSFEEILRDLPMGVNGSV